MYKAQSASNYRFKNLNVDYFLLDDDYCLKPIVTINTEIDFLFFTYIKAEHKNKAIEDYPMPRQIAEEINHFGYKTYYEENKNSRIKTYQDIDSFVI